MDLAHKTGDVELLRQVADQLQGLESSQEHDVTLINDLTLTDDIIQGYATSDGSSETVYEDTLQSPEKSMSHEYQDVAELKHLVDTNIDQLVSNLKLIDEAVVHDSDRAQLESLKEQTARHLAKLLRFRREIEALESGCQIPTPVDIMQDLAAEIASCMCEEEHDNHSMFHSIGAKNNREEEETLMARSK